MHHFGHNSQNFVKPIFNWGLCFLNSMYNSFKWTNNSLSCFLIFSASIFMDTQSFFPGHILLNSSDSNISNTFSFVSSLNTFPFFFSGSASIPLEVFSFLASLWGIQKHQIFYRCLRWTSSLVLKLRSLLFPELSSFLIFLLIILLVDLSQNIWKILVSVIVISRCHKTQ